MSYDGGYVAGYDGGWLGGEEDEGGVVVAPPRVSGGASLLDTTPMVAPRKAGLAIPGTIIGRFTLLPVEAHGGGEATVPEVSPRQRARRRVVAAVKEPDVGRLASALLETARSWVVPGNARVGPQVTGFRKAELMNVEAHGIQNPTDEELAVIAMLMLGE